MLEGDEGQKNDNIKNEKRPDTSRKEKTKSADSVRAPSIATDIVVNIPTS